MPKTNNNLKSVTYTLELFPSLVEIPIHTPVFKMGATPLAE